MGFLAGMFVGAIGMIVLWGLLIAILVLDEDDKR